ncbi:hypothetical protein M0805_000021 [Coniferiporia weirii]|nr:hypothetical protein M0805_000021 [Coniferiporia weirii]
MRSFSILSLAATAALSLFATAAPLSNVNFGKLPVKGVEVRELVGLNGKTVDVSVNTRDVPQLDSVPTILTNAKTQLSTVVVQLNSLTITNATTGTVTPLLGQVVNIVGAAVDDVNKLVGAPVGVILASAEGTVQVTITEVAQLLAGVLTVVVSALGGVLKIVGGDLSILGPTLGAVGQILAGLVTAVAGVVSGLVAELLPLVGSLVPTVSALAFNTLGGVLNLVL